MAKVRVNTVFCPSDRVVFPSSPVCERKRPFADFVFLKTFRMKTVLSLTPFFSDSRSNSQSRLSCRSLDVFLSFFMFSGVFRFSTDFSVFVFNYFLAFGGCFYGSAFLRWTITWIDRSWRQTSQFFCSLGSFRPGFLTTRRRRLAREGVLPTMLFL